MQCSMQADVLEAYQRELDSLQQQRNQAASDAAAKQASQRAAAEHSANRRSLFACVSSPRHQWQLDMIQKSVYACI